MKTRIFSIVIISIFLSFVFSLTGCAKKEQGKVVGFGQTTGYVQSYIKVKLSDNTEVKAWLPMDDKIWDEMHSFVRYGKGEKNVEIIYKRSNKYWEYVRNIELEEKGD